MNPVYLYPDARKRFPALPPQTLASLEQTCQRKYRAMRYDVVWTCRASLPTFRHPTPFPIPNQGWRAILENDTPVVSVRIGDSRFRLRLKAGPQFRRQLRCFRLVAIGAAMKGESAISERGTSVLFKIIAWLPRDKQEADRTGTLSVRTDRDCLLIAANAKDEALWRYNGDHLRRWAAEHRIRLQRWSEDAKYESRPIPPFTARRKEAAQKFQDRMNSGIHEIAAQLAAYAERKRFRAVTYDDSDKSFCEQLPWFRLRSIIGEKLDAVGINFEIGGA